MPKKMRYNSILSLANLICYVSSYFETIPDEWLVDFVGGGGGNEASSVKLKLGAGTVLGNFYPAPDPTARRFEVQYSILLPVGLNYRRQYSIQSYLK